MPAKPSNLLRVLICVLALGAAGGGPRPALTVRTVPAESGFIIPDIENRLERRDVVIASEEAQIRLSPDDVLGSALLACQGLPEGGALLATEAAVYLVRKADDGWEISGKVFSHGRSRAAAMFTVCPGLLREANALVLGFHDPDTAERGVALFDISRGCFVQIPWSAPSDQPANISISVDGKAGEVVAVVEDGKVLERWRIVRTRQQLDLIAAEGDG